MFKPKIQCWACEKKYTNIILHLHQSHLARPNKRKHKSIMEYYSKKVRAFNVYFTKSYYFYRHKKWRQENALISDSYNTGPKAHNRKFISRWYAVGD